ncbi:hypothetical protein ABH922_000065 [Rhodococcus sp. 27YEA15]
MPATEKVAGISYFTPWITTASDQSRGLCGQRSRQMVEPLQVPAQCWPG